MGFVCKFMLGMGLGFELPVVVLTLVKIGVLNYRMLSDGRRYVIVISLVLGAVLTTPEVITQVLMAVPLHTALRDLHLDRLVLGAAGEEARGGAERGDVVDGHVMRET